MDASANRGEGSPLTHRETLLIVSGVLLPTFMGSFDQTVLATALPTIGRYFGDVHNLPWLITAYMLASTAMIPLYGKVADIHGRRFALRIAILAYVTGSLVCALAPNMGVLIFGRALHGIGGGGLSSLGMIVLGDLVAPKERGKYYAYFAIIYTTAGGAGPVVGGFIAEYLHWSVIFWINIPMGIAALIITTSMLRRLPRYERPHRLDILGAVLIVFASVSFMLGLNLGGTRFHWISYPVLALFAVALVMGGFFILRLATAPEPLIPISMLKNPVVCCAIAVNSFGWGAIIGLNIVLPLYLQSVMGQSAAQAGLSLMVLMLALNITAGFAGQLLGRVQHYKLLPAILLALATVGVTILAWNAEHMTPLTFQVLMLLIGIGFGPLPSLSAVAAQNMVARHQLGISVGTMNFCRNLYSTILIAVFGAILLAGNPSTSADLSSATATAFGRVFFVAAASFAIALIAIILMEERPLRTSDEMEPD